jgi:hypothetical protein
MAPQYNLTAQNFTLEAAMWGVGFTWHPWDESPPGENIFKTSKSGFGNTLNDPGQVKIHGS